MTRVSKTVPVLIVLALLAGPLLGADEKAKSQSKPKPTAPAAAKQSPAEDSPIYDAAHPGAAGEAPAGEDVITNETLERMWAGLSPTERMQGVYQAERHIGSPAPGEAGAASETGAGQANGAEGSEGQGADAAKKGAAVAEQQKKVNELQAKVQELERVLLAARNPLLSRRYADRPTEEIEGWDDMNAPERVAATQKQLDKAKADLAEARSELTHLQGESAR